MAVQRSRPAPRPALPLDQPADVLDRADRDMYRRKGARKSGQRKSGQA